MQLVGGRLLGAARLPEGRALGAVCGGADQPVGCQQGRALVERRLTPPRLHPASSSCQVKDAAAHKDAGGAVDLVAVDFYSRYQRPTAPSCKRFAAVPGGPACKTNRLRWCGACERGCFGHCSSPRHDALSRKSSAPRRAPPVRLPLTLLAYLLPPPGATPIWAPTPSPTSASRRRGAALARWGCARPWLGGLLLGDLYLPLSRLGAPLLCTAGWLLARRLPVPLGDRKPRSTPPCLPHPPPPARPAQSVSGGLGAEHFDGIMMQTLMAAGWRVRHLEGVCPFNHAPSMQVGPAGRGGGAYAGRVVCTPAGRPALWRGSQQARGVSRLTRLPSTGSPPPACQSCGWSGGVWDDRDIVSWATAGGRCLSADEAAAVLAEDAEAEEVVVQASSDGNVTGAQVWVAAAATVGAATCCTARCPALRALALHTTLTPPPPRPCARARSL